MKKALLLSCIASTFSTGLIADEAADFEAFLGAGHYQWDDERNLDDTNSLEIGAELPMTEALSLEGWFSSFDAEIEKSTNELEGKRYSLGGLYHFSNESLRPFVSLGFGHQEFEDSADDVHNEALAYAGLGLKKYFDNNLVLRGEVLGLKSFDHEVTDLGVRLAVGYAFGRNATKSVEIAEPLPAPAPVVQPQKVKSVAKPVEENSVKPTPKEIVKPVVVPVPVDSDHDGVVDSLDKCVSTDKAFKVDETGCPIMLTETVSIKMNVKFPTNSSIISKDNFSEIQKVADFMKQFDETVVVVEGYSDDRGAAEYNKTLSQRRADSVRKTLITHFKLDEKRVTAKGYGEESPIADNNTAAGRAENRRVIAVVNSSVQKAATK